MRIGLILAAACVMAATPALAQQRALHHHAQASASAKPRVWRDYEAPAEYWSQFYGRSWSQNDSWTPNSANGS